ncbi:MAG TPA: hypothetical protein VGC05_04460, partial [Mycobacterium sp.]
TEAAAKGPALLYPQLTRAKAQKKFDASQSLLEPILGKWPAINRDFTGLVTTVQANRENYEAVAALPSFRAFPWFFVIPGAIIALLALAALAATLRLRRPWRQLRWVVLVVGVGLVVAPAGFSMWSRAPAGARMVSGFSGIENRAFVTRVQDDFGQFAIVQGAFAGQLIPTLRQAGLSSGKIDPQLPGVHAVDVHWVRILQDFTPMLGVMSNSVPNYQAVVALPSFDAFPWLFAIPGALAILVVLIPLAYSRAGSRRGRARRVRASSAAASQPPQETQAKPAVTETV